MKFHPKALWAVAAFILVLAIATKLTMVSVAAVVVAGVILEFLTWPGTFGRDDKQKKPRRSGGPRLYSGI
jgi:hypothetical protein